MVCRVQRHVEEEAKELLGWRELGGEHRLAFMTVAKEMGYSPLHGKPLTRSEHAPLAIHHKLQLSRFDDELLVCIGMKMLPAGPCLHSAGFNENIALKLTRTFGYVRENECLTVEGVTNPGTCRRKGPISLELRLVDFHWALQNLELPDPSSGRG
jgi:hypothetical protein